MLNSGACICLHVLSAAACPHRRNSIDMHRYVTQAPLYQQPLSNRSRLTPLYTSLSTPSPRKTQDVNVSCQQGASKRASDTVEREGDTGQAGIMHTDTGRHHAHEREIPARQASCTLANRCIKIGTYGCAGRQGGREAGRQGGREATRVSAAWR